MGLNPSYPPKQPRVKKSPHDRGLVLEMRLRSLLEAICLMRRPERTSFGEFHLALSSGNPSKEHLARARHIPPSQRRLVGSAGLGARRRSRACQDMLWVAAASGRAASRHHSCCHAALNDLCIHPSGPRWANFTTEMTRLFQSAVT